jgi:hypothetical protein
MPSSLPGRARLDGREVDSVLIDAGGVLVNPNWTTIAGVLELVVGARAAGLEAVLVDAAGLSADRDVTRVRGLWEVPALLGLAQAPRRAGLAGQNLSRVMVHSGQSLVTAIS